MDTKSMLEKQKYAFELKFKKKHAKQNIKYNPNLLTHFFPGM